MIRSLVKAARDLDSAGFHVEADLMDKIMQKVAEDLSDDEEETTDEPDDDDAQNFGFLGDEDEDSEDESDEDSEEHEEDSSDHSVEECFTYCKSFSHEEKVELIKALLDSMM